MTSSSTPKPANHSLNQSHGAVLQRGSSVISLRHQSVESVCDQGTRPCPGQSCWHATSSQCNCGRPLFLNKHCYPISNFVVFNPFQNRNIVCSTQSLSTLLSLNHQLICDLNFVLILIKFFKHFLRTIVEFCRYFAKIFGLKVWVLNFRVISSLFLTSSN